MQLNHKIYYLPGQGRGSSVSQLRQLLFVFVVLCSIMSRGGKRNTENRNGAEDREDGNRMRKLGKMSSFCDKEIWGRLALL